jgi:hypothetical protein
MELSLQVFLWATALSPSGLLKNGPLVWGIAGAGILVVLLLMLLRLRSRTAPKRIDPEAGMAEDLAMYPPAPQQVGPRQLTVQGQPVRVRLIVLAPVGRTVISQDEPIEPLLDHIVRGMGQAAQYDQPHVRVWPLGMSNAGFTPMFFRRTKRPQPAGRPSNWILLAGQARAGAQQVLLGLALWSDEPTTMGNVAVKPEDWSEVLRTEEVR